MSCGCLEFMNGGSSRSTTRVTPDVKPDPLPSELNMAVLEDMAIELGGQFAAALKRFAEQEKKRLDAERLKWEAAQTQLEEARQQLEEDRRLFQEATRAQEAMQASAAAASRSLEAIQAEYLAEGLQDGSDDIVVLNVGGQEKLSVTRGALTQCPGSALADAFNGRRPTLPKDTEGSTFIDFAPQIFLPLVEHLRLRYVQVPGSTVLPPPAPLPDAVLDEQFVAMLHHFGVLDWVYRQRPVEFQVTIGDYHYSVLPPQPPTMAQTLSDMRGLTVTVPRGWEVLDSGVEGFENIIWEMTSNSWGCADLIVAQGRGFGHVGYRTRLDPGGSVGSKVEEFFPWFETSADGGRQLKFTSDSYRLIIRSRVR